MEFIYHTVRDRRVAELQSASARLNTAGDALEIMIAARAETVIIHREDINPLFFDLSSLLAGEILQKFSNDRKRLAIVGEIQNPSVSLKSFQVESNANGQILFVSTTSDALKRLGE